MTPVDRAMDEIRKRRSVRTPILAALLDMEDEAVDALLAEPMGRGALIGCDVVVGGAKVKEYRVSMTGGGELTMLYPKREGRTVDPVKARLAEWRQPKPSTPEASAGVALPAPLRPAAPRAVDSEEERMADTKPLAERIIDALKQRGACSLDDLVRHAGTTKSTLYTMMGTLVKNHGVRRVEGKRGFYEIGATRQPASAAPARAAPPINGSPYAGALADLRGRKATLLLDLTKIDAAIQAVEALA